MRFLDHLKIRTKIRLGLVIMLLMVFLVAAAGYFAALEMVKEVSAANSAGMESLSTLELMKNNTAFWFEIAAILISIGLTFYLGHVISRSILTPINVYIGSMRRMSNGDLSRELSDEVKARNNSRRDELGDIGKALGTTQKYLGLMSDQMGKIADGDISLEVKVHGDKDELGIGMAKMTHGLLEIITQLAINAEELKNSSEQLATAASQSTDAISQVATTIQQVATGITQQTDSVSKTAMSVEQMTRAINGVAQGAQEQANATSKASMMTEQISNAIKQVAGNASVVVNESNEAARAAREGSKSVLDTINGMSVVKQKVEVSFTKVEEMGSRSGEIAKFVDLIEDIASQTNLLALNAAIEAARAGESGKGFAVVADEVRKLAERSSAAVKEIGELVKTIQTTVNESVAAMQEGSLEVENGVKLAEKSGKALEAIEEVSKRLIREAEQVSNAAEKMAESAHEMVASMDSVSAVVEQNTASTEEMAASSSEVQRAIENIASVSEENSAAVEEVSASAEEMTAQMEEVNASAAASANLAERLQDVVKKFKIKK